MEQLSDGQTDHLSYAMLLKVAMDSEILSESTTEAIKMSRFSQVRIPRSLAGWLNGSYFCRSAD